MYNKITYVQSDIALHYPQNIIMFTRGRLTLKSKLCLTSKQVGFFKKEARRGQHHYFQKKYRL